MERPLGFLMEPYLPQLSRAKTLVSGGAGIWAQRVWSRAWAVSTGLHSFPLGTIFLEGTGKNLRLWLGKKEVS